MYGLVSSEHVPGAGCFSEVHPMCIGVLQRWHHVDVCTMYVLWVAALRWDGFGVGSVAGKYACVYPIEVAREAALVVQ